MKAAYHFVVDNNLQHYDKHFYKILFRKLLSIKPLNISSKVLVGDLLAWDMRGQGLNLNHYAEVLVQLQEDTWKRIDPDKRILLVTKNVFIICFETIQKDLAHRLHLLLQEEESYVGAFEIDHAFEPHWWLYGECIGPKYRIIDRDFYIITDINYSEVEDYINELKEFFKTLLFDNVGIENREWRYTILDRNHHYENAKRAAEWKKSAEALFSTITDGIIGRLLDTAPDLSDKLWAMINAFETAETGEQYAQAMTSCRRIFEYVTDCLFPATDEIVEGRSLKRDKYKNRLMQFASVELKSSTNVDLIVSNTNFLFEEWNKLYDLSNKGVHDDTHKQECRRCIIRTIILLDDLVSLRKKPFDFKTTINDLNRFNKY